MGQQVRMKIPLKGSEDTTTATPTTTSKNEDSIEEGSEDKSTPCEDTGNNKRSCPRWKTYCNTHEYMKRHCKKTCNICDSPGSTSDSIEEGSEDKSTPCEDTGKNKRSCPRWKTVAIQAVS